MTITITDTTTGEKADYITPEFDEFFWSEGNNGCDCNRGVIFDSARSGWAPSKDYPCGDGRFTIRVCDENGVEVYAE